MWKIKIKYSNVKIYDCCGRDRIYCILKKGFNWGVVDVNRPSNAEPLVKEYFKFKLDSEKLLLQDLYY